MDRQVKKYLFDILSSIQGIEQYLDEKVSFRDFQQSRMMKKAVEREIEIIGEATNRILKLMPDFPLTNARKIVNARNAIIHEYDRVDDANLWGIVKRQLPTLKTEVENLLK